MNTFLGILAITAAIALVVYLAKRSADKAKAKAADIANNPGGGSSEPPVDNSDPTIPKDNMPDPYGRE